MNNIEILEDYIKEVWRPKPIDNVIPDWATIEKEQIQAIENLIQENKELKENSIPKSKVKEKIEWLEKNIIDNVYASDNDKDVAENQIYILEWLI